MTPPAARSTAQVVLPEAMLESLELLLFGAIGLTSVALARTSAADLTLVQWRAMVVIGRADRTRIGDVAARVGLSLPSASRMVRRLERRGYVTTERDETDRRATLVRLTPDGSAIRTAVIAHRRALMNDALGGHGVGLPKDLARGLALIAEAFARYE